MAEFRNCILIGAGGGIGAALADALAARGARVTPLGRATNPAVDYERPDTLPAAATALADDAPYDTLLVASGFLHDAAIGPEKSWRMLEPDALHKAMTINAIGPALLARACLPLLPRDAPCCLGFLSARVGSISDNRLGGWYGYRMAKAALNQFVRTLSIELARTHPEAVVAALHPGTVDTPLSKPFQSNVPEGQLQAPATSAARLLDMLASLTPADSGGHFDHRGEPVPA